jgi:hypothetical protein
MDNEVELIDVFNDYSECFTWNAKFNIAFELICSLWT